MRQSQIRVAAFLMVSSLLCFAYAGDGTWLKHVPEKDRVRSNPYAAEPDARAAGAKLFRQHCAECHGADAAGGHGRPALTSARIRHASDGELQWILRNGSLRNGMPSWSSLPEEQRWQIVTYLRSVQEEMPLP
jgi:mono/diheme cytochrome c family protein